MSWDSRPDGRWNLFLRRRSEGALLGSAASLADAGTDFQKRDFAAGQTTIMDELVAQRATGPPAAEKRFIAVEPFLTDLAVAGFNPQQHRLPVSAALSNTHAAKYSEGERREARGERYCRDLSLFLVSN